MQKGGIEPRHLGHKQKWLEALEQSHGEVLKTQLSDIAELYGVEPFLLYSFLFPAVPNAVVVRPGEASEMQPVDIQDFGSGVKYSVPRRNLACSEIGIAKLDLAPGCGAPWNKHPGCELLIPLQGEATAYYGPKDSPREISTVSKHNNVCVHFVSQKEHTISNNSSEHSEILVVRFYRDCPRKHPVL